jgi:Zn-dependent protease
VTPEELWQEHRQRLVSLGSTQRLSLDELLRRQREQSVAVLRALGRSGAVRDAGDGTARIRFAAALAWSWRVAAGNAARERLLARRDAAIRAGTLAPTPVPAWLEEDAYHAAQAARRHPLELRTNLAILLGSAVAFAAAMSWLLGALGGLALLAVVAFHEAGHWAAMRAFGYRDTSVFFVPFLGAAAAGRKEDAPLRQEMLVLLAGPLPGIALGVALALLAPGFVASPFGAELLPMLLFLNLFNLFPIVPLDGGRIVDRLLFGRRPRAAVAFSLLGIAGLAALALAAGDPVLGAFAGLFALGVPTHHRVGRLGALVRAAAPRDRAERVRAAFAALPPGPFARRLGLVQAMEALWVQQPARRTARLAWLGGYASCLLGGGIASVLALASPAWLGEAPWLDPTGVEPVACDAPAPASSLATFSPDESRARYALVQCLAPPEPAAALAAELRQFEAAQSLGLCLLPPWRLHELEASARASAEDARAALVALSEVEISTAHDAELEPLYAQVASGEDADGAALGSLEARLGACAARADGSRDVDSLLGLDTTGGVVRFAFASDALHTSVPLAVAHACARGCEVELRTARFRD